MNLGLAVVAAWLVSACARGAEQPRIDSPAPVPPAPPQVVAATPPPAQADPVPLGPDSIALRLDEFQRPIFEEDARIDTNTAIRRLAEMQRIVDTARNESLAAPTLLRVGLLKLWLRPGDVHGDFDALLERYPSSTFSDDAAYARTFLARDGDCEGDVACHIRLWVGESFEFLRTDRTSPYVPVVVATINRGIVGALADVTDYAAQTEDFVPDEVRGLILSYDSLAAGLPAPGRDHAKRLTDSLLARFRASGR